MEKFSNDLMAAYGGTYEREDYPEAWTDEQYRQAIADKIKSHTPKERLAVYLNWNGIIGYTGRIWEIAQGEL